MTQSVRFSVVLAAVTLTACVSQTVRTVDMTQPTQANVDIPEELLLDVGVTLLEPGIPEDPEKREAKAILPDVRLAEAHYIPFTLKRMLQSTGQWGAVRVITRPSNAVDVSVRGEILHSDGERLELKVEVVDATGEVWFKERYEARASKYAYDEETVPADIDPFQPIYRKIHDDMVAYREQLSAADVERIRQVAELRFAGDIAPEAYGDYVVLDRDTYRLNRLPAENEPMLERIRRVREREYLFIDTLEEYYSDFRQNMSGPYQNWRKYTFEEAIALKELRAKARANTLAGAGAVLMGLAAQASNSTVMRSAGQVGIIGGGVLLTQGFKYRAEARLHVSALEELGSSLQSEVTPSVIELEDRTVTLTGTLDEQYEQWREILRELYRSEAGLEELSPES
ncbi:MAG: hypothetical protein P8Y95_03455 [Gammaproteobacteria bacterium]